MCHYNERTPPPPPPVAVFCPIQSHAITHTSARALDFNNIILGIIKAI